MKKSNVTATKEIKDHLETALKEIGKIKPWFDEDVNEWIFSHPNYPVEYGGEFPSEVIENYPKYLAEFIKHRLNNNLSPLTESKATGHGGNRLDIDMDDETFKKGLEKICRERYQLAKNLSQR